MGSTMNFKKILAIIDHFPVCSSTRKKIVSGFGVGFVSSFLFLFILFSNSSFKNPDSDKLFILGFNISNNSSCTTSSIDSPSSSNLIENSTLLENSTQLEQDPKVLVSESRAELNGSDLDIRLRLLGTDGKGDTNSGKLSGIGKNGSFSETSAKVSYFKDTHLVDVKNETFGNGSVKSDGIDQDHRKVIQTLKNLGGSFEECDIFNGRWVKDETKPYYPAGSCPYVDKDINCHLNKRPDDEFVKWRWQPFGCEIPSLNATDFLVRLRGKRMAFVGDSLNRNMWESLVCILRHSLTNKKRVYEISGRGDFKKRGIYSFRFEDYNCTVDFVSSPFLVRESSFKGENSSFETLRLDLMDRATSMYQDADILIFNTGHWWTHEKTSRGENYYQEGNHVYPRLKALDAYTRALSTWSKWIDKNIDSQKTQVIFRGYSLTHFRGGQWNSGGQCHTETEPIFNTSQLTNYPSKMRAFDNVLRVIKTPVIYLNISRLTDYRKDGHPSIYRTNFKPVAVKQQNPYAEHSQDCSHWCLPGVPDTWNELLYASLLKVGRGSWKR